jgi:hypothetical protein
VKNLAGKPIGENDTQIKLELTRCGVPLTLVIDQLLGEVKTNAGGELCGVKFRRAWSYWVATGSVPLEVALKLYEHPVGRTDIRVDGHCGCPPPTGHHITWHDPETGKKIISTEQRETMKKIGENPDHAEMAAQFFNDFIFNDDPKSIGGIPLIDSYHIDSELGLYIFVQHLCSFWDVQP